MNPLEAEARSQVASPRERLRRRARAPRLAARALLRPRVRVRVHAGDDALARAADLGRAGTRAARARRAVVGMGELRLADERGRRGRGHRAAAMLFATGGDVHRRARGSRAFGAHRLSSASRSSLSSLAFVALYALVSKHEPELLAAVLRMARTVLPGAALILAAAFVPSAVRPVLWAARARRRLLRPAARGCRRVARRAGALRRAARADRDHRDRRVARRDRVWRARHTRLGPAVIPAVVLGLVVAGSFWLAYFDFASTRRPAAARRPAARERTALARDAYTYAHLPMVVGIVLFAFAMRARSAERSCGAQQRSRRSRSVAAPRSTCSRSSRFAGGRRARSDAGGRSRRWRSCCSRRWRWRVPALAALALVAAVWIGLHAYELIHWREERARRRSEAAAPAQVAETRA